MDDVLDVGIEKQRKKVAGIDIKFSFTKISFIL